MRCWLLVILFASNCFLGYSQGLTDYVDPTIGTDETHFISQWRSEGGVYPGAVAPFGMVQISPETSSRKDFLQGYYYSQDTIRRFGLSEHFSGWPSGSSGKGHIMPFSVSANDTLFELDDLKSSFTHQREKASAGYYAVFLNASQINCEFTALTRSVIGSFDYELSRRNGIFITNVKSLKKISGKLLEIEITAGSGYIGKSKYPLHIVMEFNHHFHYFQSGKNHVLTFPDLSKGGKLTFKYGGSYTSSQNAALNLKKEIPDWNFELAKNQSNNLWNEELSCIRVSGKSENDKKVFYTALYHASLLPFIVSDVNGQFPGYEASQPLQTGELHYMYFTPWDAARTLYPLNHFLRPKRSRDMLRSCLRFYNDNGRLPEPEVMTSVFMSVVFADAIAKGITDFDISLAYKGLSEMMLQKPYFRKEMQAYDSLGFVPFGAPYATTATLEFAYNDWALAQIAKSLGKNEVSQKLLRRSFNYRNNYKADMRFMQTRNVDGTWAGASVFAESDKWNMSWFVPHNAQDLINLMGGNEAFCEHLNRNFEEGNYVLDNEPPMSYPYLFTYASQPWNTMKWKNQLLRQNFNATPGGIPGNDDFGTMSAWYIWGALGLFPACPGNDELILSAPIFEKVEIHTDMGQVIELAANNLSDQNSYVQTCLVGKKAYNESWITQKELLKSGTVQFQMDSTPSKTWGLNLTRKPYSLSVEHPSIEVVKLEFPQKQVVSNEEFNLSAILKNSGATGSFLLQVLDDKKSIYSEWVLVEENKTQSYNIPLKLYSGGEHKLKVANQDVSVSVMPSKIENQFCFEYENFTVQPLVHISDSIQINCSVKNISGYPERFEPVVFLNGERLATLSERIIHPGELVYIHHVMPASQHVGLNKLRINQSEEVICKVYNAPVETLVLHYTFDDTGAEIQDFSGFENHGEIIGKIERTEGYRNNGVRFLGGHIEIPPSPSMNITGENLTIVCWYKPVDEKGKGSLVSQGGHNMLQMEGQWQIKFAAGGWGRGECFINSRPSGELSVPLWNNQWINVAGVCSANNLRTYLNGVLMNQLSHRGKIGESEHGWRIGTNSEMPKDRMPDGVIDEVMVFAGALTQNEIENLIKLNTNGKK